LSAVHETRADSLRCGDQLASTGASLYEVRATCGEPDAAFHRIERRTVIQQLPGPCVKTPQGRTVCGSSVAAVIEVTVDEWTYDFGRDRFIHYLTFEDGRLILISNGGYGKKPPA
jgi:hypothetical protein